MDKYGIQIGDKYENWKVIGISDNKLNFLILCDCGEQKYVNIKRFNNNDILCSCGYIDDEDYPRQSIKPKPQSKIKTRNSYDLEGLKLNKLSVLYRDPVKTSNYICLCDCGNYISVSANQLGTNHYLSCGCIKKSRERNLVGQKFSQLLVIEKLPSRVQSGYYRSRYKCICDCGKEIEIGKDYLLSKNQINKSCGCIQRGTSKSQSNKYFIYGKNVEWNEEKFRSKFEAFIAMILSSVGIEYQFEPKMFQIQIEGRKTGYLPDFYLPKLDLWLELKESYFNERLNKTQEFSKTYNTTVIGYKFITDCINRGIGVLYNRWIRDGSNEVFEKIKILLIENKMSKKKVEKQLLKTKLVPEACPEGKWLANAPNRLKTEETLAENINVPDCGCGKSRTPELS